METHGPLGTLFVGLGLGAFYIALIWINTLLGFFTTPLFIIPLTWVQDAFVNRRARHREKVDLTTTRPTTTMTTTQASPASTTPGVPTDRTSGPPAPKFPR